MVHLIAEDFGSRENSAPEIKNDSFKGNVEVSATCSAQDFHRFVAESLWISEQCAFKDDMLTTGNSPDSSSDSPLTTLLSSM